MSALDAVTTGENLYISSTEEKAKAEEQAGLKNKNRVGHDDFLKLLTTQLTHQDPLNPMQDRDFIAQLAQLQALDEQIDMTAALVAMRQDNQLQAASGMIGKHIVGQDKAGSDADGVVKRAVVKDNETYLELENLQQVLFSDVVEVKMPVVP